MGAVLSDIASPFVVHDAATSGESCGGGALFNLARVPGVSSPFIDFDRDNNPCFFALTALRFEASPGSSEVSLNGPDPACWSRREISERLSMKISPPIRDYEVDGMLTVRIWSSHGTTKIRRGRATSPIGIETGRMLLVGNLASDGIVLTIESGR